MAGQINELLIKLEADTSALRREMERADKAVSGTAGKIQQSLSKVDGAIAGMGAIAAKAKGGVVGLLAAFTTASIVSFINSNLAAAAGIGELAEQLGVSTDGLQAYQFAATQTGVKAEELQTGLARLTRTIGEAAAGDKKALDAFNALGVGILDANGKVRDTDAVFADVAESIRGIEDPAKRAAAVVDLFGKSGQKLLPMLAGGAAGIRDFKDQAEASGQILRKDLIDAADRASDRIEALKNRFSKNAQVLVAEFAPALDAIIARFEKLRFGSSPIEKQKDALLELAAAEAELQRLKTGGPGTPIFGRQIEINEAQRKVDLLREQLAATDELRRFQAKANTPNAAEAVTSNPRSKETVDAETAITDSLRKKVALLQAEADAEGKSEAVKERLKVTAEALEQARAKGIGTLTAEQAALIDQIASLKEQELLRKTQLDQVKAYIAGIGQEVDAMLSAEQAAAALQGTTLKANDARNVELEQLREQITAAGQSEIRYNALTKQYEVYDRQLQIVRKTQQLLAADTNLSADAAREQAEAVVDAADELSRGTDDLQKRADSLNDMGRDLGLTFTSAFEDAIVKGASFRDVLKGIEQDIARIIIRKSITEPASDAIGGLVKGFDFGGIFGSLFGGGGSVGGANIPMDQIPLDLGFFADGGRPPTGVPSVVGERGPELFVPDSAGTIIPNHKLGGGGGSVVVNQSFSFGVGFDQVARVEAMKLMPVFKQQTIAAIEDRQQRGRRA